MIDLHVGDGLLTVFLPHIKLRDELRVVSGTTSLEHGFVEIVEVVGAYGHGKLLWRYYLHNYSQYFIIVDLSYELVERKHYCIVFLGGKHGSRRLQDYLTINY